MTQVTVEIPDNKLSFFIELVERLGFAQVEKLPAPLVLTEQQKNLVEAERNKMKANPDSMIDWEQARNMLKTD